MSNKTEFICTDFPPTRGNLILASCTTGSYLAKEVFDEYTRLQRQANDSDKIEFLDNIDYRFANTETCVRLTQHIGGHDVFLFQSLCDPTFQSSVDQNYMAFLMAARAFKEHGATHITAILPYLAYGRQDKPTEYKREPTSARLMADLSQCAGIDRLITYHPHCGQIRGFYGNMPTNFLDPLTLMAKNFERFKNQSNAIVVAPDAGATKLALYLANTLNLECAIGSKFRPRPDESVLSQIAGDFSNKTTALVIDDELSTGGTLKNLVESLVEEHGIREVYVGISHNRCLPLAKKLLQDLYAKNHIQEVNVTNSMPQTPDFTSLPFVSVCCLSETLARTINRIHTNTSVSDVFLKP